MSDGESAKTTPPRWLTVAKELSQIMALLATPIILAGIGYWTNRNLQSGQTDQKYVEMAIAILSSEKTEPRLHNWARDVVNAKSPVPLPELTAGDAKVFQELNQGGPSNMEVLDSIRRLEYRIQQLPTEIKSSPRGRSV